MAKGRPKGYKPSEESKERTRRSMLETLRFKRARVDVEWAGRQGWRPYGDRLDFLSFERQHLQTGKLSILPAKERHGKEEKPSEEG